MRYIQRGPDGTVLGHYASPQAFETEEVPDDHEDIKAWKAARAAELAQPSTESRIANLEAEVRRLARMLERLDKR